MTTSHSPSTFLSAILEGFLDGILVVTTQQQLLYSNHPAHHFCQRLEDDQDKKSVPAEIWQVCESFMQRYETSPQQLMGIESEVKCENLALRVRVQWLTVDDIDHPCILVRLQDQQQSLETLAIADAHHWHLTEREAQVWMLRRAGLRRKQIAAELYISEDTVKKHLGNIRAKRQSYLDEQQWQQSQSRYSA